MQTEALKKIVLDIKNLKAESQTIELKTASKGCPTRLFDTLSSFSNQDEGGVIIFGIDEANDYDIVGVYDAQDLQKRLLSNVSKWSLLYVLCLPYVILMGKLSYQQKYLV